MQSSDLDPRLGELQVMLEWAGARMLSLPSKPVGPADARSGWPDCLREAQDEEPCTDSPPFRPHVPTAVEISLMDRILGLPSHCTDPNLRTVVQARTLIAPLSGRYLFSWKKLAKKFNTSAFIIQSRYRQGLRAILTNTPSAEMCSVWESYTTLHNST